MDFSSGRGAGAIGTVMAAIVLGGFVILYFFVFDESMAGGGRTIQSVIKDQGEEIARLQSWTEEQTKGLADRAARKAVGAEADQMQRKAREGKDELAAQSSLIPRIQSEIEQAKTKSEAYKAAYRSQVRNEGKGLTYPELKTLSGKVYQKVVVTSVDAVGMNIQHQEGTSRVQFAELSPEIGEHFQYSPDEQSRKLKNEQDQFTDYNTGLDHDQKKTDQQNQVSKEQQATAAAAEITRLQGVISQLSSQISTVEQEMRNARASNTGVFNPAQYNERIQKLKTQRTDALSRVEHLRSVAKPR